MRSVCLDMTPWTGSLSAALWLQLSPVSLLEPEFHVEAPARQSAPGPEGWPSPVPLRAERTVKKKRQGWERYDGADFGSTNKVLYEFVCGWVNMACSVKCFEWSTRVEKHNKKQSTSFFIITSSTFTAFTNLPFLPWIWYYWLFRFLGSFYIWI